MVRNRELKIVRQIVSESNRWTALTVRKSDNYTVIVTGIVDSESSITALRSKLKESGTRRTFIAVGTNTNVLLK